MNKQLLRVGEAADVLAVSRWTIYRWARQSQGVPHVAGTPGAKQ